MNNISKDLLIQQLPESLREGYKLLESGLVPSYSTGICECVTCGYGALNEYGYWEHPLCMNEDTDIFMTLEDYFKE